MADTAYNDTGRRTHRDSKSAAAEFDRLEWLARNMDAAFRLPIIGTRIGWDGVLGLIPGVGDVATLGPGLYILYRAHKLGASRATLSRMAANMGVDFVVGSIPLLGDLFDMGFKSNLRNVRLLRQHLDFPQGHAPKTAA
ncbi:DUF4112 domain-containing protein [Pseudooceanicola nanhaiensis]|uniref:DUF4112 domain-containing protein n=1 Tax=Pseudooceanicola nanhaiensis TaxID=375761 RepID=UPI0035115C98